MTWFLGRRLIMAVAILFFSDIPTFQIMFFLFLNKFTILFMGMTEPWQRRSQNRTEITNEMFTMLASYHLICFTSHVPNIDTQYQMGYSMSATIILTGIFNFIGIISGAFYKIRG